MVETVRDELFRVHPRPGAVLPTTAGEKLSIYQYGPLDLYLRLTLRKYIGFQTSWLITHPGLAQERLTSEEMRR